MTGKDWNKLLFDNEICDAYQYISNSRKTISTALFCKELILSLIAKMEKQHDEWKDDLYKQLFSQENGIRSFALTNTNMPSYALEVCGVETNALFLLDKLTKDFFQYIRNAFDSLSQAVNAICLASSSEKVEKVDFRFMKKVFEDKDYGQLFPSIYAWFSGVASSSEFSYIEAFNNRTKHICDVYLKLSMAIFAGENETRINPFVKKGEQHQSQSVAELLAAVYDFTSKAYTDLLSRLKVEVPKHKLVQNRFHRIHIYQEKVGSDPKEWYSLAYIESSSDIADLPDEIEVLLAVEREGIVEAKNCPINTIYIKNPRSDHDYIGRYVTSDPYGDDTLLMYRKYQKIPYDGKSLPLCFQAKEDPANNGVFYHANPFMEITVVSDDEEFVNRTQLPF